MAPVLIGLEEHYAIPQTSHKAMGGSGAELVDLGPGRLERMDKGNISIQVLSHIPTIEPPDVCRAVNDQCYEAISGSGGRYRGFAIVPIGTPEAIPEELQRCVQQLGFVGTLIPNHVDGQFYDAEAYWPMFEKAQELDVPIYIHPAPPPDLSRHAGNYDPKIQMMIAGPALCWHTDVATHMLRLYASGLFDTYPRLKIIIGHNGETLPFMLDRTHRVLTKAGGSQKRDWATVWNENIWITTSGMFHLGPLQCCLAMCKPDRIMYSKLDSLLEYIPPQTSLTKFRAPIGLDYPFSEPELGLEFMESLQKSKLVSEEQFEMICSGNAKKLLRI